MAGSEDRAAVLGLEIPDFSVTPYYGLDYGSMKAHHQVGNLLFLSGHIQRIRTAACCTRAGWVSR